MSETYKEKKIDSVSFGIMSLPQLEYSPPSSCFGPGDASKGPTYRTEWEERLVKSLSSNFKKQKFISIQEDTLEAMGISAPAFYSEAENELERVGVEEYESKGGELRPIEIVPAKSGSKMKFWGTKLKEKDSIDFLIALVKPRMSGEVQTSSNAGFGGGMNAAGGFGGGMNGAGGFGGVGGGTSSRTIYTTNVRFGIWSTETGELVYASGSIAASSGFCVFMSPQSMSIEDNTSDMSTQLKALITAFLNRHEPDLIKLGQAMTSGNKF